MGINLRYFSVEEAEALIGEITEIFATARRTKTLIEEKVENWRRIHKKLTSAEEAVIRGQVDYLATQLESQLGRISELGATPKDLDMGLVDFPVTLQKIQRMGFRVSREVEKVLLEKYRQR